MKTFRFMSIIIILTLILSACAGNNTAASAPKAPLRIAWDLWPGFYPLIIADQKGFFKEEGVDVEMVLFDYKAQIAAQASGQFDGGGLVITDFLYDALNKDVKIILITDNSDGADQIVASSDIHTPHDLIGKRIGVQKGTYSELFAREMLLQNKIPLSDVTFVDATPDQVPDAIPTTIDAGHSYAPFTSQSHAKGQNVIFSSSSTPGLIADVFAFRNKTIKERPEDIQAFVNAWFKAEKYWQEYPAEANALIAKITGLKVEEISLEGVKLFDQAANANAFKQGNDTTSIYFTTQKHIEFLTTVGSITNPVKSDDVLDASFVQNK